jgi:serine/threonine protein kinase
LINGRDRGAAKVSRQPLPRNTILGSGLDQYRIDSVLGPGGFGITYLAESLRIHREVAIKEYFPAEFAYRDGATTVQPLRSGGRDLFADGLRYFIEEARVLGRFRHEHIVRVIGLIEQFGTAYMVLEFEEGVSFKRWLQQLGRAPTQSEIDGVLEPILSALDTIHAQQLFHRDIAPDNIIIRPNGKPVLIDFGAARHFARENSHTLGAIVKSGYSPPEQYTLDTKLQGAWSDVYALAATMHHALMGRPPEEASKRQLHDTALPIEDHLDPVLLNRYRPAFLEGVNAGLALKPRDRPATIAEWRPMVMGDAHGRAADNRSGTYEHRNALDPAVHRHTGSTARTGSTGGTVTADEPRTQPQRADAAPTPPPPSRGSGPGLASALQALALAAAALGGVGFFWFGGVAHNASWGSVVVFIVSLGVFVAAGITDLRSRSRGPDPVPPGGYLPNTAAAGVLGLAAFWLPPFVLPTYYLSAALLVLAALSWLAPRSRLLAGGLVIVCTAHLVLALWVLAAQPFGANRFVLLLGIGLAVLAGLSMGAAGMWMRRTNALRHDGANA